MIIRTTETYEAKWYGSAAASQGTVFHNHSIISLSNTISSSVLQSLTCSHSPPNSSGFRQGFNANCPNLATTSQVAGLAAASRVAVLHNYITTESLNFSTHPLPNSSST
jgi:hypothetical protein